MHGGVGYDDDAFKSKLGIEPSVGPIPSDGRVLLVVWGRVYGLVLIKTHHTPHYSI